jgi:hypothetical protein
VVPTPALEAPPFAPLEELSPAELPPLARRVEGSMKYESPPGEVVLEPAPTTKEYVSPGVTVSVALE